ncbi:MAG: 3-phosphoshikimate 1-carboxyvinyltransferase [Clostridiales bacterium]|nr:3-phosphoshikimate 1-carboxyvinyltransferase [Clostridiales bacterium]
MQRYEVKPMSKNLNLTFTVPGSKSITNRALLMAALSKGCTTLSGVLFSDDSRYFLESLKNLGFEVDIDEDACIVKVVGHGGKLPQNYGEVMVGSAGTAARFITCMCGLSKGTYTINASEQMKKRPMQPLFDALISLGAKIEFLENENYLPVKITGCGDISKKIVELDISRSTQFLSAFLMAGCMVKDGMDIHITSEKKYGSYIRITMEMMKSFGVEIEFDKGTYRISPNSSYSAISYQIEPDVSAACYFYGMAALSASKVKVKNVFKSSLQGDIAFLNVLEDMGCNVYEESDGIAVVGPSEGLNGIEVDMNNFSDQTMTLAVIAPFAKSITHIKNVGHIRVQESDRLSAIATELTKLGVRCIEGIDDIVIYPGIPQAGVVETYEDHRMAMAFTLIGLMVEGIVIDDPLCCRKTFENYFEIIDQIK